MLVVLTFNQPHRKTQDILLRLAAMGVKAHVVCREFIERKNFIPTIQHRPANPINLPTEIIAKNLGHTVTHTLSENLFEVLSSLKDLEYVLLATGNIIEQKVAEAFKIINAHPALLPLIKGLDALKWAVYHGIAPGVTSHFINAEVDAGVIIQQKEIPVYSTDTFHSLAYRQYECEIEMLVNAPFVTPDNIVIGESEFDTFRRMPHRLEAELYDRFESYKKTFAKVIH